MGCESISNRYYPKLLVALLLCIVSTGPSFAQNNASINGFVKDATSGETLLFAIVILVNTVYGTATNNSGYYTLTGLPEGTYEVVCTYIGYTTFLARNYS